MDARVFLDSNVIIYSYSNSEASKQHTARKLIADGNSFISTQVLQEIANIISRKFHFPFEAVSNVISECSKNSRVHTNSQETIFKACALAGKYGFSFYDSLILAAALETGCSIIYSEDMAHGQIIEKTLRIRNPFL